MGWRVITALGTPIASATRRNDRTMTTTVGTPEASISRATCPTDT